MYRDGNTGTGEDVDYGGAIHIIDNYIVIRELRSIYKCLSLYDILKDVRVRAFLIHCLKNSTFRASVCKGLFLKIFQYLALVRPHLRN